MGVSATFKVNVCGSTSSRVRELLLATLSPNHDLVKEAFGMAQFETSRKLMTSSNAKDLLFIYGMTVNNCCLFTAAASCTHNPKPQYYCDDTRKRKSSKLPTDIMLQRV